MGALRTPVRAAALAWLLPACGTNGALGQIGLGTECVPDDVVCLQAGLNAPLAVGAELPLDVDVQLPGSAAPPLRLETTNPDVLTVAGHRVTAAGPGIAAILITTHGGRVLDFAHLWTEQPDELAIHPLNQDGFVLGALDEPVELLVGDETVLSSRLRAGAVDLAGSSDTTWTTDSTSISVLSEGRKSIRRIVARAPGEAVLTVAQLGLSKTVGIRVIQ